MWKLLFTFKSNLFRVPTVYKAWPQYNVGDEYVSLSPGFDSPLEEVRHNGHKQVGEQVHKHMGHSAAPTTRPATDLQAGTAGPLGTTIPIQMFQLLHSFTPEE